jgi:hypothetical protein
VSVWDRARGDFEFRPGGVFANVVLADEINRASPKTQSALLEAMEEQQVTIDAQTYPLPAPFLVIATQNPVELEGTYPLPEAQLDRFLLRLRSAIRPRRRVTPGRNTRARSRRKISRRPTGTRCEVARSVACTSPGAAATSSASSRRRATLHRCSASRAALASNGPLAWPRASAAHVVPDDEAPAPHLGAPAHALLGGHHPGEHGRRSRRSSTRWPCRPPIASDTMITRRGWALTGAALGLFIAGRILGLVELAVLAVAAVLTLVLAFVWVRVRAPRLVARRELKERLQVGVQGRVDVVVHAVEPTATLSVNGAFDGGRRATPVASPCAGEESAAYRFPTRQRPLGRPLRGRSRSVRSGRVRSSCSPPRRSLSARSDVLPPPDGRLDLDREQPNVRYASAQRRLPHVSDFAGRRPAPCALAFDRGGL